MLPTPSHLPAPSVSPPPPSDLQSRGDQGATYYPQPRQYEYCPALEGQHRTCPTRKPSLTACPLSSALLVPVVLPGAPSHCSLLPAFLQWDTEDLLPFLSRLYPQRSLNVVSLSASPAPA